MIKLIVSDLDGTLVPEGTADIHPQLFDLIRKLSRKGILFVAASGRQYMSMRSVLEPVENEISFISDNGACQVFQGKLRRCHSFSPEILQEILDYVRRQPEVFVMASTAEGVWTDCNNEEMIRWIREGYQQEIHIIEDLAELGDAVVKVAVFCHQTDGAALGLPAREVFAGKAAVTISGERWVDFVAEGVDKGRALREIQQEWKILPEETMAFGDNHNDLGMLACAKESYAAKNAREEVKKAARYVLEDDIDNGVFNVLKRLL